MCRMHAYMHACCIIVQRQVITSRGAARIAGVGPAHARRAYGWEEATERGRPITSSGR